MSCIESGKTLSRGCDSTNGPRTEGKSILPKRMNLGLSIIVATLPPDATNQF
jgi:hypothetical protein